MSASVGLCNGWGAIKEIDIILLSYTLVAQSLELSCPFPFRLSVNSSHTPCRSVPIVAMSSAEYSSVGLSCNMIENLQ